PPISKAEPATLDTAARNSVVYQATGREGAAEEAEHHAASNSIRTAPMRGFGVPRAMVMVHLLSSTPTAVATASIAALTLPSMLSISLGRLSGARKMILASSLDASNWRTFCATHSQPQASRYALTALARFDQ